MKRRDSLCVVFAKQESDMLTIPNAVEEVIKKKPFLEGALVEGLINLSALARQLKPEIEKQVGKTVNDSAVIMALNRLVPRLELMSAMKFKKLLRTSVTSLFVRIWPILPLPIRPRCTRNRLRCWTGSAT